MWPKRPAPVVIDSATYRPMLTFYAMYHTPDDSCEAQSESTQWSVTPNVKNALFQMLQILPSQNHIGAKQIHDYSSS